MDKHLSGKVVVITGAARGLGRALCNRFAAGGAKIVASARTIESLTDVAKDLEEIGADFHKLPLDVRHFSQCSSALQATYEKYGAIDILINNASGYLESADLRRTPLEDIEREIDVTFRSVVYMTKAVVEHFIPKRSGTIINIASTAGIIGRPGNAAYPLYAACKSAVIQFTEAMSESLSPHGVRCCMVAPCAIQEKGLMENRSVSYTDVAEVIAMQCHEGDNLCVRSVYLSPGTTKVVDG